MAMQEVVNILDDLNEAQREAVLWDRDALLVIAGPGTGKTRVLTRRIAKLLLDTSEKSFRILGLTFTNKAADEMKDRVEQIIPGQNHRLFLGTFHSFCAEVLRQHGTHIGINPNFRIYSHQKDLQSLLDEAVEEARAQSPLITDTDKKLLPVIRRLKSSLILPEDTHQTEVIQGYLRERASIVYTQYEAQLSFHNALDFDSLILRTYQLFTKYPAIARRYRTVYPYICIDEFQDTNAAQYGLISALTSDQHRNIFVVADDDQIIYQWNGASHKRLGEFQEEFQPHVIQLPENYRCPSKVIELANNLIRHNFLRDGDKKPLVSHKESDDDGIRILSFSDFGEEIHSIAADIQQHHGNHLGEVTVLARNRKLLELAEKAIQNLGLRALIVQRKDDFESTPFIWLHATLRLANDRQNRADLEALCGSFSQLTSIEVDPEEVVIAAKLGNGDYLQHWLKLGEQSATLKSTDTLANLALALFEKAKQNLGEGRNWKDFSAFVLQWFSQVEEARKRTDEDSNEVFANYTDERKVWLQIVSGIRPSSTLEAFLQELEMRSKAPDPDQNTVKLMTIHGAKGQEFFYVYLIGMVEGELPSFQSVNQGDNSPEMEEERRNCFVAITRVQQTLTLSYSTRFGNWDKKPSRFLVEMGLLRSDF